MKIMITGDSHTGALKLGADYLIREGQFPQDEQIDVRILGGGGSLTTPFFVDRGDCAEMINGKHQKRLKTLPVPVSEGQYDYYGICGPLYASRLWRRKHYWLNYTPLIANTDKAPISNHLLKHVILQEQCYTLQLIKLLQRVGTKVFVVEAPRPFKQHPSLKSVGDETALYIDNLFRTTIREWLAEQSVPVINVPEHCYDSDGFMDNAFQKNGSDDYSHANRDFGIVMIKEIIAFAQAAR